MAFTVIFFGLEKGFNVFFFLQGEGQCARIRMATQMILSYSTHDKRQDTSLGATDSKAENAWRWRGFMI
ncbi:unnamed protein product [Fusarium venenatum]|uniref:Uncharacterized protein n=1 Tax=Fusarium venenatum TaxID=56646 RepID=A0A2L2TKQ5_9HYPO|nr:LOW QUALITY PROTEIN: uncharacterized protein FVRRES_01589 [Fusarium venenatum]CEI65077.1 unnamed protein product [Fusarium venenatum]